MSRFDPKCLQLALLFALMVGIASGCGRSAHSEEESLKFFGLTYFNYMQVYQSPPKGWEEIEKLADAPGLEDDMQMLRNIKAAGYVVVWEAAEQGTDAVLAYHPSCVELGGKVLLVNGSLELCTSDELRAKLK